MKKTLMTAIFAASAASVMALPSLDIDFRSAAWAGANGSSSFTVGGVTATAFKIAGGSLPSSAPANGTLGVLSYEALDGLGVDLDASSTIEEIEGVQSVLITFSGTAGNDITGFALTDIFGAPADGSGPGGAEIGKAAFSDGTFAFFTGTELVGGSNGELYVSLGGEKDLLWVEFYTGVSTTGDDFSVAGFTVPDSGSTLAMIGLAMIGVGAARRGIRR